MVALQNEFSGGNPVHSPLDIFTHQVFITGLASYMVSQSVKLLVGIVKTRQFSLYDLLFVQGGLPSSHSSTVASVTAAIFLLEGASNLFMLSLLFTFIVLIDAAGVRWETGKQTRLLNRILKDGQLPLEFKEKLVSNMGHTPVEVILGSVVGIGIAVIIHLVMGS
jgi:acid phosphatase family membrane protein YuiD